MFVGGSTTSDLILAGPVRLDADIESNQPDFHVFARLFDRSPDGGLTRIAQGQARMLGARSGTLSIDLLHIGYLLRTGHALQLHVQSSDYPEFAYSTGTDKGPWEETHPLRIAHSIAVGEGGATLVLHTLEDAGPSYRVNGEPTASRPAR